MRPLSLTLCLACFAPLAPPVAADEVRDVPSTRCTAVPEVKSKSRQRYEAMAFMVIATELEAQGEKNFQLQYDAPASECLAEAFEVDATQVAAVYSPWEKGTQTLHYRFVTGAPESQERREVLVLYNGTCAFVLRDGYCFHVSERRDGVIGWYAMFRDEPTYPALKSMVADILSGAARPLLAVRWPPGAPEGEIVAFDERLKD